MTPTLPTPVRAPASAPWLRGLLRRPAAWIAIAVLAYLVVVPFVVLAISSLRPSGLATDPGFTFDHYLDVYGSARTYRLLLDTVVFGVGGTAIALVLGTAFAWLVERTDLPGARLFRALIILPMAMPPVLLAVAWILLLSPSIGLINTTLSGWFGEGAPVIDIYTMGGMMFVQGLAFTPTAFLLMLPSLRNMDPALEDAASAAGASQFTIIRKITLPMMRPGLLASAIYLFIISLLVFDIPGMIGMRGGVYVLSSEIYYQISGSAGVPDFGFIGAMAFLPVIVLLPLAMLYQRLLSRGHRYVTITSRGYRPRRIPLGRWRWLATVPLALYLALGVLLPLAMLIVTSLLPYYTGITADIWSTFTLDNYERILTDRQVHRGAINSVVIGLVVATVLALGAPLIAHQVVRVRGLSGRIIDRIAFIPVAFSNTMIGVALIFVYLSLQLLPIYGTIWIIAVAHLTSYLTFATRSINGALLQVDGDLESAARVSGAGALRTLRRITYPLLRPAILVVWLWVMAHSLRELSASLILAARDNQVIPTLLWSYWQGGDAPAAAALGVCLIIALAALSFAWDRAESGRRRD